MAGNQREREQEEREGSRRSKAGRQEARNLKAAVLTVHSLEEVIIFRERREELRENLWRDVAGRD